VSSEVQSILRFLDAQRADHRERFPGIRAPKVLSYMATTSLAGSQATVSVHRVKGVGGGDHPSALEVDLAGRLARAPEPGDCISVHLTRVEQYRGFQVKTRSMAGPDGAAALLHQAGDTLRVHGHQLFTVHHSPYTLRFFEEIPLDEVRELAGQLRFALCAVGPTANLSPRFVFHHEVRDGRLSLFHGDGLALKTAINLATNPRETRVVLDLGALRGWQLRGAVAPIAEADDPVAFEKVVSGFASGGWGRPSRVYRFTAEELAPLAADQPGQG
jgi:hypothetical protein